MIMMTITSRTCRRWSHGRKWAVKIESNFGSTFFVSFFFLRIDAEMLCRRGRAIETWRRRPKWIRTLTNGFKKKCTVFRHHSVQCVIITAKLQITKFLLYEPVVRKKSEKINKKKSYPLVFYEVICVQIYIKTLSPYNYQLP